MRRLYYDLHLHSCLSPCGDDESTPCNLAGMLSLSEIDVAALTDHNTTDNCPTFFSACEEYGIIPIAGMELTTSEDIHVVCLFETLACGMAFGREIEKRRCKIKNRPDIFGRQQVLGAEDAFIREEEDFLLGATDISLEDVPDLVSRFGGVSFPAHIDRDASGVIAVLGTFPETPHFSVAELHDGTREEEYRARYGLADMRILSSSDAHRLENIRDAAYFLEIPDDAVTPEDVRRAIFSLLRGES